MAERFPLGQKGGDSILKVCYWDVLTEDQWEQANIADLNIMRNDNKALFLTCDILSVFASYCLISISCTNSPNKKSFLSSILDFFAKCVCSKGA